MTFNYVFYIFIGFFTDILNNMGLRFTVKKFLEKKQKSIIFLSLSIRLIIYGLIFYLVANGSFRKAIFFVVGVTLSRILLILINWRKYENINR